jgi:hypothetical protein
MILEIFILLLSIGGFFMWYGFFSGVRAFSIVGLTIFFLLGSYILLYQYSGQDVSGLQYRSGNTVTSIGSTTTITYNYTTWNDNTTFWVGLFFTVISGIGIVLVGVYQE